MDKFSSILARAYRSSAERWAVLLVHRTVNSVPGSYILPVTDLTSAIAKLDEFARSADITRRLGGLEARFSGVEAEEINHLLETEGVESDLLDAAVAVKRAAGQINVVIHALGTLLALPHILEADEVVQSLSLGAGNTGRDYDLETNRRVAEFKFINWRGGAEAVRQNSIFVDLLDLLQDQTARRRYLYVLDKAVPLRFLAGKRSIRSILSRNSAAAERFESLYGDRYTHVNQWYSNEVRGHVQIEELSGILPSFAKDTLRQLSSSKD